MSQGRLEIALYAVVTTAVQPSGCAGGIATTPYTVDLPSTRPLGSRTVVLDHSPPDNPVGARPIPRDATVADYLNPVHPDRAGWTSDHPVYDLLRSGTSSACDVQTGYLSLLFPTDGYAVFEPAHSAPAEVRLPLHAEDTRYRAGPVQLWVERDLSAAYLVVGDDVQRWLPARGCLVRSIDLPRS